MVNLVTKLDREEIARATDKLSNLKLPQFLKTETLANKQTDLVPFYGSVTKKIDESKKGGKNKAKIKTPYINLRHRSIYNIPPYSIWKFLVFTMTIFTLLNWPSLANFLYLRTIHSELEEIFQSSVVLNMASSSTIMLNALMYLHYYHHISGSEEVFSWGDLKIMDDIEDLLNVAKTLDYENYFKEQLNTHICDNLEYLAPELPLTANQKYLCRYATFEMGNFNFIMALSKIITNYKTARLMVDSQTSPPISQFFSQPDFIRHDLLAIYTSLALQRYTQVSGRRIIRDIKNTYGSSNFLTTMLVLTMLVFVYVYRRWGVADRIAPVQRLLKSLTIVNDAVVANRYLKSAFGGSAMSIGY